MQNQSSIESGKVIAFGRKSSETKGEAEKKTQVDTFEDTEKRNREVADRLKRERAKANRSVLRAYRIKN